MKKSIRKLTLFTILFLLISSFSVSMAALYRGDETERNVFDANDFHYNSQAYSLTDLTLTYESDEISDYVTLNAKAGTYANNNLVIQFKASMLEVDPIEKPFIKLAYKTDMLNSGLQIDINSKRGNAWLPKTVSLVKDETWNSVTIDLSSIQESSVAENYPALGDNTVILYFKPWGSHSKTLSTDQYFSIRYIAFFETSEEAESFVFEPISDNEYRKLFSLDVVDSRTALEAEIRAYLADVEALKKEIIEYNISADVTGTKYYVSPNGNDENDGKSPDTPWKTVGKVNEYTFNTGDGVYFKRGGIWREQLKTKNGVTYSAYGSGAKPALYGSVDGTGADKWTQTESENIWVYNEIFTDRFPANIVFNNETAWGIKVEEDSTNPGYRVNRGTCWNGIGYTDNSALPFTGAESLGGNLEFWYDSDEGKLYLYCDYGNPGEYFDSLELCLSGNGVHSNGGSKNVTIDNLCIKYAANHGVGAYNTNNFTVQYCVIGFIGGNGLGNAIESWTNADNYYVHHNYAYQCYDCAFTAQGTVTTANVTIQNVTMHDNIAEYCNSGLEFWLGTSKYYYDQGQRGIMRDVDLYNNYTLYAGYGWSSQRPGKDYNFFYGGLGTSYTTYDNITLHGNVNMFTRKIGLRATYISNNGGYAFSDNVYVMHENAAAYNSARLLADFMSGNTFSYIPSEYNLAKLQHYGVDNGSSYRFISENYLPYTFNGVYDILPGDVNGDGELLPDDEIILTRYLAIYERGDLVYLAKNADFNGDGAVTPIDAVLTARKIAGYK